MTKNLNKFINDLLDKIHFKRKCPHVSLFTIFRICTTVMLKSYDAKIDSKKRITLRNTIFEYFHVEEYDDGRIVLEPRELTAPFQVSANTLKMMDSAMENLKEGKVSEKIDLSEFDD